MPSNTVTCPFCNSTLKSKTPVPGGTRVKCPGCSTQFVVKPDDAEDVPPTVAAPKKAAPRPSAAVAPKPAAPKPAAPKPPAAAAKPAAPKPAQQKPSAAVAPKPAAPKPAAKKPAEDEELVEVAEDDVIEIPDEEAIEIVEDEAVEITEPVDEEEPLEEIDDGPPRRRRQRGAKASGIKGIPLWVWLTGGGVLAVVVLGGLVVAGVLLFSILGGPAITKENFDKIQPGASEQEVIAIMGQPNSSPEELEKLNMGAPSINMPGGKILVWRKGNDVIVAALLQGKVIGKNAIIGGQVLF